MMYNIHSAWPTKDTPGLARGWQRKGAGMPPLVLVIYCLLVFLASWMGGAIPSLLPLTHTRMQLAISFVAGVMLGVGLLHMLPHAALALTDLETTAHWVLGGFVVMFFLQRFFHFHHHFAPDDEMQPADLYQAHGQPAAHPAGASHSHPPGPCATPRPSDRFSWGGAALGLTVHSAVDGIALAAAVEAERAAGHAVWLAGLATFLAVVLHKPFDSLTITTLMAASGRTRQARLVVNTLYALMVPTGVVLFYLGVQIVAGEPAPLLGRALAFSAGAFLCIAASDLLPELHFHSHDRVELSLCLVLGIAVAWAIESGAHSHDGSPGREHPHEQPLEPGPEHQQGRSRPTPARPTARLARSAAQLRLPLPCPAPRQLLLVQPALGADAADLLHDRLDDRRVLADAKPLDEQGPGDGGHRRQGADEMRQHPRFRPRAQGGGIGGSTS